MKLCKFTSVLRHLCIARNILLYHTILLLTQYTLSLYFHLPYRSFKISPAYITNYGAKPLESGKLDVYLEEWGTLDPNSVGKANIERLGTIGYVGSNGWYANKAAYRPGWALDSYTA